MSCGGKTISRNKKPPYAVASAEQKPQHMVVDYQDSALHPFPELKTRQAPTRSFLFPVLPPGKIPQISHGDPIVLPAEAVGAALDHVKPDIGGCLIGFLRPAGIVRVDTVL